MKKKLRLSLSKIPSIIIAIDTKKEIIFYNNAAKHKFLFIDEGRDLNNVIRSTELNTFIDKEMYYEHKGKNSMLLRLLIR